MAITIGVITWLLIIFYCIRNRVDIGKNIQSRSDRFFFLGLLVIILILLVKAISAESESGWYVFLLSPIFTIIISLPLGLIIWLISELFSNKVGDVAIIIVFVIILLTFALSPSEDVYRIMSGTFEWLLEPSSGPTKGDIF